MRQILTNESMPLILWFIILGLTAIAIIIVLIKFKDKFDEKFGLADYVYVQRLKLPFLMHDSVRSKIDYYSYDIDSNQVLIPKRTLGTIVHIYSNTVGNMCEVEFPGYLPITTSLYQLIKYADKSTDETLEFRNTDA